MSKISWDSFFYYGENAAQDIENDLIIGMLQDDRSLFFNRQDSAGVKSRENYPNSIALAIGLPYAIMKWIAYRNGYVSQDDPDMRVASSQANVGMDQDGEGGMEINLLYIMLETYDKILNLNIPIFGG